jgi:hypothetical protein
MEIKLKYNNVLTLDVTNKLFIMTIHWIIRVGDGENFRNSRFPVWGVNRRWGNENNVKKIKKGDIIWFLTSCKYGGKLIGMCEFCQYYDRLDEPLLPINTVTNEEQNWVGGGAWDIQIQYTNLYVTEKQNIKGCIHSRKGVVEYEEVKDEIVGDLYQHYCNFKYYAECKSM